MINYSTTNYSLLATKSKYAVGDMVWFREFRLLNDFPWGVLEYEPNVYTKWNCGMIIKRSWLKLENQMGYQLDCDRGFQYGRYMPEEVLYEQIS